MKKTLQEFTIKDVTLYILLIVFGYLSFTIFLPYLNVIVFSFIIVQIFYPVYKWLMLKIKNQSLVTALSVLIALTVVISLIVILGLFTISEIQKYFVDGNLKIILSKIQDFVNSIIKGFNTYSDQFHINSALQTVDFSKTDPNKLTDDILSFLHLKDVATNSSNNSQQITQILFTGADFASKVVLGAGSILFNFFLLLFSLVYLFPNYDKLPKLFRNISPLEDRIDDLIFDKFIKTINGTIKGTLLVAVLQATVMIIPMIIFSIPSPVLFWLVMVVVSIVPIGSGVVWFPVGLLLIFNGISSSIPSQSLSGIFLIVFGTIIVNIIDTPLRSRLIKDTIDIHPLISIFSILGGLALFGFLGILYGPLIVVIFFTIVDVYNKYEKNKKLDSDKIINIK